MEGFFFFFFLLGRGGVGERRFGVFALVVDRQGVFGGDGGVWVGVGKGLLVGWLLVYTNIRSVW